MTLEWDEIANRAWDRSEQAERTIRSYMAAFDETFEGVDEAIASRDGGAMRRFRQAADNQAPGIESLLPTFLLLALRAHLFLEGFQEETKRLDVISTALTMAYVAGFNTAESSR